MDRNLKHTPRTPLLASSLLLALTLWLTATSAQAQEATNLWSGWMMTRLESLQTNADRVIIKAASPIGSVPSARGGTVAVIADELTDTVTGQREYGVTLTVAEADQPSGVALVDYDELDLVLNGLDYLSRVDWTVTSLSSLDAFYITKDGFRAAAFSSKRTGTMGYAVRTLRSNQHPAVLMRDQLAQLRGLIQQAKAKIDSIRVTR